MNKINSFKPNTEVKPDTETSKKQSESAFDKLAAFRQNVSKTDFCNSYSRYSIEFKLLQDAICEAERLNKQDLAQQLKQEKSKVIELLGTFGVKLKD